MCVFTENNGALLEIKHVRDNEEVQTELIVVVIIFEMGNGSRNGVLI